MPSLMDVRRKIKSVAATEQITKAMQMVAAARMRRSQSTILSARPFALKMEELVRHLAEIQEGEDLSGAESDAFHPFLDDRRPAGRHALVLVTGDKGLCGAFNANLLRRSVEWLREHAGQKICLAVVGRKGREFLRRLKGSGIEALYELAGIFPRVSYAHAELLGKVLMDAYLERGLSDVTVIYNEFKSIAQQQVVRYRLLPIPPPSAQEPSARRRYRDLSYEPGRLELLAALLPRYVKGQLYRILLESQAAELAARMNAMDAASKNAKDLREALKLDLNRRRQAGITREIAELVGGAEALVS
ncbi:MAG: ATP synthase F1 subunit gamma [Elusimicrobia bacterium]|nr:ATP synthase F1 subunit gamma [Elusimicrobiota bacterium]